MIALVAAVPLETELLRRYLSPCEVRICGRRELFRGTIFGQPAVLMHCGVGKANAAAAVSALIDLCHPSLVISVGCGGAYPGSGLVVGDLALATEEVYGDEGVRAPEGFLDMEDLGFALVQRNGHRLYNRFPVSIPLVERVRPVLEHAAAAQGRKMAAGTFVTVSTGSGTDAMALDLAARTGGICENMEGAALAQICALHDVSFLEFRGISNPTGDRNLALWDLRQGAEMAQLAVRALMTAWRDQKDRA